MELAADAVLEDDNEYIALEIKEDIQEFGKQAQQIKGLLQAGAAKQFSGHEQYEEA
jgi:hypothetical protein